MRTNPAAIHTQHKGQTMVILRYIRSKKMDRLFNALFNAGYCPEHCYLIANDVLPFDVSENAWGDLASFYRT